jgi:hypothetical protein
VYFELLLALRWCTLHTMPVLSSLYAVVNPAGAVYIGTASNEEAAAGIIQG